MRRLWSGAAAVARSCHTGRTQPQQRSLKVWVSEDDPARTNVDWGTFVAGDMLMDMDRVRFGVSPRDGKGGGTRGGGGGGGDSSAARVAKRAREAREAERSFPWSDVVTAEFAQRTLDKEAPLHAWAGEKSAGVVVEILEELKALEEKGCVVGVLTYTVFIEHALLVGDFAPMQHAWADMVRRGIMPSVAIWAKVLRFHAKRRDGQGVLETHRQFLESGTHSNVALDIAFLDSLVRCGLNAEALAYYAKLDSPGRTVASTALRACRSYEEGRDFVRKMELQGIGADLYTYGSLLSVLSKAADVAGAEKVFVQLQALKGVKVPEHCWMHLLYTYRQADDLAGALALVERMREAYPPHKMPLNVPVALVELCTSVLKKPQELQGLAPLVVQGMQLADRMSTLLFTGRQQHQAFYTKVYRRFLMVADKAPTELVPPGTPSLVVFDEEARAGRRARRKYDHQRHAAQRPVFKKL